MPWKVKTFILIDQDPSETTIYHDKDEANAEALQAMFMQPGEIIAIVVECDKNGNELDTAVGAVAKPACADSPRGIDAEEV